MSNFQVGDEVRIIGSDPLYDDCDVGWVIRNVSERVKTMYVMRNDGSAGEEIKAEWYKTGRHNDMLAEVINALPSVNPPDHDGCKDCKYETYPDYYYPCCECKQNYKDEWQKKEGEILIKVLNTTDVYEGHDKYVLLELEKTGKKIILKYGDYANIEYNRKDNEITLDLDVFRDLLDIIIEEVGNGEDIITY